MATISFNPTVLADSILEGNIGMPALDLTGVLDLESVEVYGAILANLDSSAIKYGCSLTNNCVVMNAEDIPDYIEELTTTLIELAGVSELDLSPVRTAKDSELPEVDALKSFTNMGSISDIEFPEVEEYYKDRNKLMSGKSEKYSSKYNNHYDGADDDNNVEDDIDEDYNADIDADADYDERYAQDDAESMYLNDDETQADSLEIDSIISDHISECLLECLKVLTGTHAEVSSNKIEI